MTSLLCTGRRCRLISLALQAALCVLALRLVWIQAVQHGRWSDCAARVEEATVAVAAQRGAVLDREGRPLAMTVKRFSVFANPRAIGAGERGLVAERLAEALGVEASALRERLGRVERVVSSGGGIRHVRRNYFVWLARRVSREAATAVLCSRLADGRRLPGIGVTPESLRVYPYGKMLCHVLGFVGVDGTGLEGLECRYDWLLGGKPGEQRVTRDGFGRALAGSKAVVQRVQDGRSLVLTIDSRIQRIAEEELGTVCAAHKPEQACVVVMDPHSGDVLAMADWPAYDPSDYQAAGREVRRHLAVAGCLEPGSTFKPFAVAAALELGVVTPETRIDCHQGMWRAPGRVLHDAHAQGMASVRDVIAYSSNIGAAQIGLLLGRERLYWSLREFGFGRRSGIELPGESAGILRPPDAWSRLTITSLPMGQEVACSPLQLAAGFCVFANGGWYVRPRIVLGETDADGRDLPVRAVAPERRRVLSAETARVMCGDLLAGVVERGTAQRCAIAGYRMAGKTGTAQIASADGGGYEAGAYTASFVGIVPVDEPRYVILMMVKRPSGGSHYGGVVAAPGVARVAERVLSMARVPRAAVALRGRRGAQRRSAE